MAYGQKKRQVQKNPRNPVNPLYKALTKLFSGPINDTSRQNPRHLKRWQLDKFQFTSATGREFKKSETNPFEFMQLKAMQQQNRQERMVDFDSMEYQPEIASALDMYADEMTTYTAIKPVLNIQSPNPEVRKVLKTLFYDVLNIEHNSFGLCRSMCKYGDFFWYLDIDEKLGVQNAIGIPSNEVERLEGEDPKNPRYIQFQWNTAGLTLEDWQVAHFRILGNDKFVPYGTSILDSIRRVWRCLNMVEDAMMAYRIVRAADRRIFYIDVGALPNKDVEGYLEKVRTEMKRNQIVDATSGRVDLRYNPTSIEEDYFIPVRGDKGGTRIDTLQGSEYNGVIEDVKYLRDKLFSGLKIPQSYLTYGEGGSEERSTLAQKDVHFARTIMRIQKAVVSEFVKIARIHLYVLGFKKKDLLDFTLSLNPPSKIAELQEIEHWKAKFDVAAAATESIFSTRWIAKNIHGLTDEEYLRNLREKAFDKRFEAMLETITQEEMPQEELDAQAPGGGLDDVLPGGSMDAGGGGDSGGGGGASEEPTLLAQPDAGSIQEVSPSNKSKVVTTTAKSKGKEYHPSIYDKRKSGARKRSWLKSSGLSYAEGGPRNTLPGASELGNFMNDVFESIDREYERSILEREEQNLVDDNFSTYIGVEKKKSLLNEVVMDSEEIGEIFKDIPEKNDLESVIRAKAQDVREKIMQYNQQKSRGIHQNGKK